MLIFTTVYIHHVCSTACHCVDLIAYLKFLLKSIINALENQLFFISFIIHRFLSLHGSFPLHHSDYWSVLACGFFSEYCHLDLDPSSLESFLCSCRSFRKVCTPTTSLHHEEKKMNCTWEYSLECLLPCLINFFTASDLYLKPPFFRRRNTHLTTHVWLILS